MIVGLKIAKARTKNLVKVLQSFGKEMGVLHKFGIATKLSGLNCVHKTWFH
jgi:hypothetical protein